MSPIFSFFCNATQSIQKELESQTPQEKIICAAIFMVTSKIFWELGEYLRKKRVHFSKNPFCKEPFVSIYETYSKFDDKLCDEKDCGYDRYPLHPRGSEKDKVPYREKINLQKQKLRNIPQENFTEKTYVFIINKQFSKLDDF